MKDVIKNEKKYDGVTKVIIFAMGVLKGMEGFNLMMGRFKKLDETMIYFVLCTFLIILVGGS